MSKLKYFKVRDNSQQQCIDTDCSNHYLAGTYGKEGKTVKVLVQPFKMQFTFMGEKHQLSVKRPGLRIGTPLAAQGAALEKDCRPDAVAVVHR